MGNWNRRYLPRKKFRQYEYEDPPLSPPRSYNNQSYSSGVADNRVLSWEIEYCNSVRVPWNKVLASKKYIYCYPSVLSWDASAGKEALENAKQRYWAMINGLPCDNPLPDPDLYIDEIDWNLGMDPELIADLDLHVFNPDEAQKAEKLETISEGVESPQMQYDKNQCTSDNPWERNDVQGTGNLKDFQGWDRWDDSVNLKNGNPWEQSCSQHVDSLKDDAWRSGNESWGWNKGIDNTRSSPFVDHGCRNFWNINGKNGAIRQEGWGQGHRENNSWGWGPGNTNAGGVRNLVNCGYPFENNCHTGSKERGWRDNRNEFWGKRDAEYQGNEPKYWNSRGFRGGGRSFRGGCRKRESSLQHTSKYKSSRYHGDSYGDGHQL